MLELITFIIGQIATGIFAEYWLHGSRIRKARLGTCIVAGLVAYFVLFLLWREGAFLLAMIVGQVACLVYDYLRRDCQILLCELCLYLCANNIWLPWCIWGEDVWKYAIYLALVVLCVSLIPSSRKESTHPILRVNDLYLVKNREFWIISSIPCAGIVLSGLIFMVVRETTGLYELFGVLLSTISFLLSALLLWLQWECTCRLRAEILNDAMNRWQKESRDYMNTIRSQRHDFNLHLHAISGLVNSGKYEESKLYVQKLVSEASDVNDIMPVCDAVVGSMLYNMRKEARARGSNIHYTITYDMEDILCNGFECNKIIGNLLQNALDALQTPEDKAYGIHLSIFKRGGNTVIVSENRFVGDPNRIAKVFEPGYSTKKGHDGIGLSMVMRTVEHYGGRVYPEFDEEKIRFIVNVPNKIRLQKEGA